MGAARRRIDLRADAAADDPSPGIYIITVDVRAMVFVLFEDTKASIRRGMSALSGRDRTVDRNFIAIHQVGALLCQRNDDMGVVRRNRLQNRVVRTHRRLPAD